MENIEEIKNIKSNLAASHFIIGD